MASKTPNRRAQNARRLVRELENQNGRENIELAAPEDIEEVNNHGPLELLLIEEDDQGVTTDEDEPRPSSSVDSAESHYLRGRDRANSF